MSKTIPVILALTTSAVVGLLAGPADATNMLKHNAGHGCESLVTQAHPDLKGKERRAEIGKCKGDADAYSKSAGF
jgi:hypothetical protein